MVNRAHSWLGEEPQPLAYLAGHWEVCLLPLAALGCAGSPEPGEGLSGSFAHRLTWDPDQMWPSAQVRLQQCVSNPRALTGPACGHVPISIATVHFLFLCARPWAEPSAQVTEREAESPALPARRHPWGSFPVFND